METLRNQLSLVSEMQAGSAGAFGEIYKFYSPRLYLNVLRIVRDPLVAEEIIQEIFVRLWQKKNSRGVSENLNGYMITIAQNLVHDYFRKLKRDRQMMEKFKRLIRVNYKHIEESLELQQTTTLLRKAIEDLAPQQKRAYKLVKIEGHTYKRAAEIMGISPFTVKEYLVTSVKSIRNYLIIHSDNHIALSFYFLFAFGV